MRDVHERRLSRDAYATALRDDIKRKREDVQELIEAGADWMASMVLRQLDELQERLDELEQEVHDE